MNAHWHMKPVVYRVYDTAGILLYIGSTGNARKRWMEHRSQAENSEWAHRADRFKITTYPSILDARAAERFAIQSERPMFNSKDRGPAAEWTKAQFYGEWAKWMHRQNIFCTAAQKVRNDYSRLFGADILALTYDEVLISQ